MSVIYEALKKVEKSAVIIPEPKTTKVDKPGRKNYLFYLLIVILGFFIIERNKIRPQQNLPLAKSAVRELSASIVSPAEAKKELPPSLALNGIFFSGNEGYALINNQIVKEGDGVGGAVVKRITVDAVELEAKGLTTRLSAQQQP